MFEAVLKFSQEMPMSEGERRWLDWLAEQSLNSSML